MRFKQTRIFGVLAAKVDNGAALFGYAHVKAQLGELLAHPLNSACGKSGGTVDSQQRQCLLGDIFGIFTCYVHNVLRKIF